MRPDDANKTRAVIENPAQAVWAQRYRADERHETSLEATFARVASALAAPEGAEATHWNRRFQEVMAAQHFIPAGRILAGAGRDHDTTLANCFVMGTLEDSIDGIFNCLKESALTLQAGGGIGIDFSPLRPRGAPARRTGRTASGPVSFLHTWNQVSDTLLSTSPRGGAMMAVMDCAHPDVPAFIRAKQEPKALEHFNVSVLVTDAFMRALEDDADWTLAFNGRPHRTLPARELWNTLLENNRAGGEPGALFIDRINARNRLNYCETIRATNPCGELPLPPYGACLLGSLILPRFVRSPFTAKAAIDWAALEDAVQLAVRMLDNAVSVARFPLERQREVALHTRRIGIGVTGLADMMVMLNHAYDGVTGREIATEVMRRIRDAAYLASSELAKEKEPFPALDAAPYLRDGSGVPLPDEVAAAIRSHGIRNSHLTAIAPTGSISLLAGNVSSGIEPMFERSYRRRFRLPDATYREMTVENHAVREYRQLHGKGHDKGELPPAFRVAHEVSPEAQVDLVAALQPYVDSGISKTIGLPADAPLSVYDSLYRRAWREGLKGMTTFPQAAARGAVLLPAEHCHAGTGERCD